VAQVLTKTAEAPLVKGTITPCILDDDPAQLDALAALIDDLGYQSITTSDPDEALECVRCGRSRLLLADLRDTGLYGYEFLDRVLRTDPGVHVIVMTRDYTLDRRWKRFAAARAIFCPSRSIAFA
jgi:DNA-binding NtrC family response regulator